MVLKDAVLLCGLLFGVPNFCDLLPSLLGVPQGCDSTCFDDFFPIDGEFFDDGRPLFLEVSGEEQVKSITPLLLWRKLVSNFVFDVLYITFFASPVLMLDLNDLVGVDN